MYSPVSHTLWDTKALIEKNNGKAPRTMSSFQALIRKMAKVEDTLDAPKTVPSPGDDGMEKLKQYLWNGSGAVPSLKDLDIEEPPQATKFKVCIASWSARTTSMRKQRSCMLCHLCASVMIITAHQ